MLMAKRLILYAENALRFLYSSFLSKQECLVCKKQIFSAYPICESCIKTYLYKPLAKKQYVDFKHYPNSKQEISSVGETNSSQNIDCIDRQFSFYPYLEKYVDITLCWKNRDMRGFSFLFAFLIAHFIKKTPQLTGIPIVPVPPRPKKLKTKGWDQIEDICSLLESFYNIKVSRILGRQDGHSQKGLSKKEREENLKTKIYLKKKQIVPKKVIILDDVITTGSTLNICSTVLKNNGCDEVLSLVLFFN